MTLDVSHIIGILLTLLLVTLVTVFSSRKVSSAKEFNLGGGSATAPMVSGSIIGTLVGGASTVATAQLAFTYGFSALWFCLGAGLGCLILGLFFVKPMRQSGYLTLQEMIRSEYGEKAGFLASVLGTLGIFFNMVAQILSGTALLGTMFNLSQTVSASLVALLMISFVIVGGMQGLRKIGTLKTFMLYACILLSIGMIAVKTQGFSALASLPKERYFNLFARGFGIDAGAGFSLIVGVLSTQTYAQSVLSAKDDKAAVRGSLLSACLIPPIGVGSVLVGLYMKTAYPSMDASQAFGQFLLRYMPGIPAGVFLAVLLITIIGCGAGLSLGVSSVIINNFFPNLKERKKVARTRLIIALVLVMAVIFTIGDLQSIILQWSFMSMGLRGAVLLLPLIGALFLKGRINHHAVILSMILGPLFVLLGKMVWQLPFDSLFLGLGINVLVLSIGMIKKQ